MNKKNKLLIYKVLAVVVWIALLLTPTIYANTREILILNDSMNYNYGLYQLVVECSEEIVEGSITIEFFDENEVLVDKLVVDFEDNEGSTVILYLNPVSSASRYIITNMDVVTPMIENVRIIMYIASVVYMIFMTAVLRMKVCEKVIDDKTIEIYAGLKIHTISVDGKVLAEKNKFMTFKPVDLTCNLDENTKIIAQIDARRKISVFTQKQEYSQLAEVNLEDSQAVQIEQKQDDETSENSVSDEKIEQPS